MGLNYGGARYMQLYRVKSDFTNLVKKDGTTALSASYTAGEALLSLGGSEFPIIAFDPAFATGGAPNPTITAKLSAASTKAVKEMINLISPRIAGASAGGTNDTGYDIAGYPWGDTASAENEALALIVAGAKTAAGKHDVDIYIVSFDESSGSIKFEPNKANECQLKFKGVACGAELTIPVSAFTTDLFTAPAAAFTIDQSAYMNNEIIEITAKA
jgi:hypothetical protein